METRIHKARVVVGFALIGAVAAGALFGWSDHADAIRAAGALSAIALAKINHLL